ncbi:transposase [Chondromyces crocatus]|uniref:Transposase DDE domain-containing protein n=1 Tax=Chondromyces crocatus TaxID=52 RepID=A0A0K1EP05_CHOCO|nr:uncharacterized protein CMC5_067980 [Chondromyces crocatus]
MPPAQLALASLLQAALGVPDHEVVELTAMDLRWQMVLDCLGAEEPIFSQGTLFNFRQRLIDHDLDRELFDKTVHLARESGGFSATHLRAAFDSSPLWGAGRVEDTLNLIGRAAKHVVRTAAEMTGRAFVDVAREAGVPVVTAISISDADMRHGRKSKSKSKRIDGYKRHLAVDLDAPGLVCGVAIAPANRPKHLAAAELFHDIARQGAEVQELYIDRGDLGDEAVEARRKEGMRVHCKPFPLRNGELFSKREFTLDLEGNTVCCPNEVMPLELGRTVHFPASSCSSCPKRAQCTRAQDGRGRSLTIHPNEPFLVELRTRAKTPEGRAELRQRLAVEHGLAKLHDRARYRGTRKNLFDLRRHVALSNLAVVDHQLRFAA